MKSMIIRSWRRFLEILIFLVIMCSVSDCYDPLDPKGNIAVTFDIFQWTADGYVARVTLENKYKYRHVDRPGWTIGWSWTRTEVIWSMAGAFATQQGNCTDFKTRRPHTCQVDPTIVDLTPDAAPENRCDGCCRNGILSANSINPLDSLSSFIMTVGNLERNTSGYIPVNLTLMAPGPGYTCGPVEDVDPTVSSTIGGRREEQVYRTWKSTCTYSSYVANKKPVCCLSLSTFYNPAITSCPNCSCGCPSSDYHSQSCIRDSDATSTLIDSLSLPNADVVECTPHMCPLRVHWHIKTNYREYWRVKLTISNYNYKKNYSDWNVLVQHPGFSQPITTYSFNSTLLPTVGIPDDDVALFWGLEYVNDNIMQAGEKGIGSVTTEILFKKDLESFTLSNGWAFPRRLYINGENCEMPLPDIFPMLPNGGFSLEKLDFIHFLALFLLYLTLNTSLDWL